MRKVFALASVVAFALSTLQLAISSSALAATKKVIIGYFTDPDELDEAGIRARGGKVKHRYSIIPAIGAEVDDADLSEIKRDRKVKYVEPDYKVQVAQAIPNDLHSGLWGLNNTGQSGGTPDADIDAPEAWTIQTGNEDVVIAVIDTGVDYDHEDLAGNMWKNLPEINGIPGMDDDNNGYTDDYCGYDFYNNDSDPMDDMNHGTHCSGIIAAVGNNGTGIVGVNWNARIMALKFLGADGGYTSDAILAIEYAITMRKRGVPIVAMSNSWGGRSFSSALLDAITAANDEGILFIAAAGNTDGENNDVRPFYPASYDVPNAIAVAATDHNDALATFSNYGPASVDLAAPGVSILSTASGNGYSYSSGTSMAVPHVAGVVGLIKAQFPGIGHLDTKDRVLRSVDPVPGLAGKMVTGGRLNAWKAMAATDLPVLPTDLVAIGSDEQVALDWSTDPVAGYNVYRREAYGSYTTTPINASPVTLSYYTDTGLENGTRYYYVVTSVDAEGNESGYSNEASASPTDSNPPATTTDLAAMAGTDSGSIVLTWTAPGDNGIEGTASRYDIRYWESNITNAIKWKCARQCAATPSPSRAGAKESFTVTGLSPNTRYYFALKTADEVPNWSEISNSARAKTGEGQDTDQPMHVSNIAMSLRERGAKVNAVAKVTIVDATGVGVKGAVVSGAWSGLTYDSDTGVTNASGEVILESDRLGTPSGTFIFTVHEVVKEGWVYDETGNGDFDGYPGDGDISNSIAVGPAADLTEAHPTGMGNVFPSPANPETWIPFTLSKTEHVVIRIYNPAGQLVRSLDLGQRFPGTYMSKEKAAYWDGRNEDGESVSSGIYFCIMEAGRFRAAKMILIVR